MSLLLGGMVEGEEVRVRKISGRNSLNYLVYGLIEVVSLVLSLPSVMVFPVM